MTGLTLLLVDVAWACAVCSDPNDKRADAYFDMTMFMSLLPLTGLALAGYWLYRQYGR